MFFPGILGSWSPKRGLPDSHCRGSIPFLGAVCFGLQAGQLELEHNPFRLFCSPCDLQLTTSNLSMAKYLLTCACGEDTVVEDAQAGGRTTCGCGKPIEIPTLRQLRHLPPAPGDAVDQSQAWSVRQGIFSTAIICGVFACLLYTSPSPRD